MAGLYSTHVMYSMTNIVYEGKSENKVPYFIATK
jgi:hypothetical protein